MMVNANLMLVVVMLWTGSLTLASPRHQPNRMSKFWGKSVCDKYDLPENAVWIPRANCEDNKSFECKPGHEMQVQTTCKKNGKWHLEPSCQAVQCPSDEDIANSADKTPSAIFGNGFIFDCLSGFTKNGLKGTLTCGEKGEWIMKKTCEAAAVECPEGKNISNSDDLTQSGIYDDELKFNCSVGYTRNGTTGTVRCDASGEWSVIEGCEIVVCPEGNVFSYPFSVTQSGTFGDESRYICIPGIEGIEGTATCGASGEWLSVLGCQATGGGGSGDK